MKPVVVSLAEIIDEILPAFLNDRVKARELRPDGAYVRLKPRRGQEPSQAQLYFRKRSRDRNEALAEAAAVSRSATRLVPIQNPTLA